MDVELRYIDDCPNRETADHRLAGLARELGITVTRRLVRTSEEAESLDFRGSPTILVDGRDPFASGDEPVGLSCRVYRTPSGPAGCPTVEQLRAAMAGDG